jgi:hypothetical protein
LKPRAALPYKNTISGLPGDTRLQPPAREDTMKFMLTFAIKSEAKGRDEAIARFKKTGGQPPNGVKLLGRWTAADFSGGFDLLETDDATALTQFALMWSDLLGAQARAGGRGRSARRRARPRRVVHAPEKACPGLDPGLTDFSDKSCAKRVNENAIAWIEPWRHVRRWIDGCNAPEVAMIRKLKSGQYRLYSRKINPKTGRRRNLGTFATRAAAEKHERAVQYFKRAG